MDFSAYTYKVALSALERCGKYGFEVSDIRLSFVSSNGNTHYYRFRDYASALEHYQSSVVNVQSGGMWSLCDFTVTRILEFLPRISFAVRNVCGSATIRTIFGANAKNTKGISNFGLSGRGSDEASRIGGALLNIAYAYARTNDENEDILKRGVYGDVEYADSYWLE